MGFERLASLSAFSWQRIRPWFKLANDHGLHWSAPKRFVENLADLICCSKSSGQTQMLATIKSWSCRCSQKDVSIETWDEHYCMEVSHSDFCKSLKATLSLSRLKAPPHNIFGPADDHHFTHIALFTNWSDNRNHLPRAVSWLYLDLSEMLMRDLYSPRSKIRWPQESLAFAYHNVL